MRDRSQFVCHECGTASPRWMGRCPGCGSYNTMVEEWHPSRDLNSAHTKGSDPVPLNEVAIEASQRHSTHLPEVDRVLGGGIVPGALMLLGGDPGIGKSTLMLQVAAEVSRDGPVLYATAEESAAQTRMRAERFGPHRAHWSQLHLLADGQLSTIEDAVQQRPWRLVIVDSLQTVFDTTLESAPGSVSQVRAVAGRLLRLVKSSGIPAFLVGHVNKEGSRRPRADGNAAPITELYA